MFKKLFILISILFITSHMMGFSTFWYGGSPLTVDNTTSVGLYSSMKVSKVPSWIVPYSMYTTTYSGYIPGLTISSSGVLYGVQRRNGAIYISSKNPQSTWGSQSVSYGTSPDWFDIALDGNNHVHVSYFDYGDSTLHYITNLTGTYTNQTILSSFNAGAYTNIGIDQSGNPHVVFYDAANKILLYGTTIATIWTFDTVGAGYTGEYSSMVMGKDNRVHVAFIDDLTTKQVYYAVKSGSSWTTEPICSISSTYSDYPGISIAVSDDGNPQVAFVTFEGSLLYAVKSSGTWSIQTVDTLGAPGMRGCSLKLDQNGIPHIAYNRNTLHALCYATQSGNQWNIDIAGQQGGLRYDWPALAINTSGNPEILFSDQIHHFDDYITKANNVEHYAYYDETRQQLKHGTGIIYGSPGYFSSESIDTVTSHDSHTSIVIDKYGNPFVAYGDSSTGSYRFAVKTTGQWLTETIDSTGFNSFIYGGFISIGVGDNEIPQVAYYNYPGSNLKYGIKSTSTWVTQSIGTINQLGFYDSIVIDHNNMPHISFSKSSGGYDMACYTYQNGTSWVVETIPDSNTESDGGLFTSLALDSKENPHISYSDVNNNTVVYSHRIPEGGWKTQYIDTTVSSPYYTSIALDMFNNPHIAYYSVGSVGLFHAQLVQKAGKKWYIDNVVNNGNGGSYPSMDMEQGYLPEVSFYSLNNKDLLVNNREPSFYTLPDIKVLAGQSVDSAYGLKDYVIFQKNHWYPARIGNQAFPNVNSTTQIATFSMSTFTSNFAQDSVWFYEQEDGYSTNYWSQYKQSSFLLKKLPRVISEGTTILENGNINLINYLSQSTTYTGETIYQIAVNALNSLDTGSITPILSEEGNINLGSLSSPLNDEVDITAIVSSDTEETDWDKEMVRIYPVLNTHSEFSTASETTKWAFELPANVSSAAQVSWDSNPGGPGGGTGNLVIQFTSTNQGIKLTPLRSNWVPTEPNQWYMVRLLMQADPATSANNNIVTSLFGFNGELPSPTDIGAYVTVSTPTAWTWYEIPVFSSGTSMYCQIQIKNTTTSTGKIRINKYEIVKAPPATVLEYGTPHVSGSGVTWDSASDTSKWAFELMNGVTASPSYSANTGIFDLSFAGDVARGIKMTASLSPGVVRSYPMTVGKTGGMSLRFRESGSLSNPLILIAVYGTDSANSQSIKELGAYANIFHVASNDLDIIRFAYPVSKPNGYMQMQFKNSGAAHFYIDDIYQELDQDLDNYWDNGLFP